MCLVEPTGVSFWSAFSSFGLEGPSCPFGGVRLCDATEWGWHFGGPPQRGARGVARREMWEVGPNGGDAKPLGVQQLLPLTGGAGIVW